MTTPKALDRAADAPQPADRSAVIAAPVPLHRHPSTGRSATLGPSPFPPVGSGAGIRAPLPTTTIEIVVPAYNEEQALARSVRRLRSFLDREFPFPTTVTIADNASTDLTWAIAQRLEADLHGVHAVHIDAKGRGLALRTVWSASTADVVAYMDVDLATDLHALLPLVAPLVTGHSEVAIGSRLARGAKVVRGPRREFISRCYNLILKVALRARYSDAQCGFKAVRSDVARTVLPVIRDDQWFFDTELLTLAQRSGMRIHEVAVDWVDDPDSRVNISRTAIDDLKGVWRLLLHPARVSLPKPSLS